ncbi:MAG: hypothetical protein IT376_14560, partial [Polyangiaceae bacterium]|nr:hypothetical protein [Polyangiaceae bacterium]
MTQPPLAALRSKALRVPAGMVTLIAFVATLWPAWARAEGAGGAAPGSSEVEGVVSVATPGAAAGALGAAAGDGEPGAAGERAAEAPVDRREPEGATDSRAVLPAGASDPGQGAAPLEPVALPSGADKSGVTSQAISVPQGAGKIDGMGESFSTQLSTGGATFAVPFVVPAARGGGQVLLGLSYSSGAGAGSAGMGWEVGVPFVARQTDRGIPSYDDRAAWHAGQDRFVFNGGQELVPICTVTAALECAGALVGAEVPGGGGATEDEAMPAWSAGWQYFRPRVEGSFQRFFWSPDHRTWRVQDKSGVSMELGAALDGSAAGALERNPARPEEIYRWHLARQYDTYGAANAATGAVRPHNVAVYVYSEDEGTAYLTDAYHTTPAAEPATADTARFAHHVRLAWEARTDPTESYRGGWRMVRRQRLARVDVTSKPYGEAGGAVDASAARKVVRRYHLGYEATSHVSLLERIEVEGRCSGAEAHPSVAAEDASGGVGPTSCPRLPPMTFTYSRVSGYGTDGAPGGATVPGYEPFDARLRSLADSPPHSVDEGQADLFDVNGDALPDVLVTAAGMYGSGHGVFFQSPGGAVDRFGAATPMSVGLDGAGVVKLSNLNVAALDLDADGVSDLLHMPKVKTYSAYRPVHRGAAGGVAAGWHGEGRSIAAAGAQSPKIDLGNDAPDVRVMDVDFDGLVDVVVTAGTEVQTFFHLGRYPGGDGQFGQGTWTSASTATLSLEPVRRCVPWSGTPVRFSDPDVKLADLNGDGVGDIVRVRRGDVRYWPGRGNGYWGTGDREGCAAGTFGAERHVAMATSPWYSDVEGESLRLDDVNGDGLDDLVQVRFTGIDVWLNVDGAGWSSRIQIDGTPAAPSYANRVRLVDMNGNGTRDVLWGDGRDYRYVDLQGGTRPHLLVGVANGLGKTTELEYSTSTEEMRRADAAYGGGPAPKACGADDPWECPWARKMPVVVHVVKRVTERDHVARAGGAEGRLVTEYEYRDPVYEGRQREFRGFERARARRIGDESSPSDVAESTFLLGECASEDAASGTGGSGGAGSVDPCALSERWRDNPREALKGLPVVSEERSAEGVYVSTTVSRYQLATLYEGLDGRAVRWAHQVGTETFLYDTGPFVPAASTVEVAVVDSETRSIQLRSSAGRVRLRSETEADRFGNQVIARAYGCVEGCERVDERIASYTIPARPAGDPTGWLWRTVDAWGEGSAPRHAGIRRARTHVTFDAQGAPVEARSELAGTLALDRSHATGADVALPPPTASADGLLFTSGQEYDPAGLGTLVREQGAGGRCRELTYDTTYAQLVTAETIYTGGCGAGPLVSSAGYDRGFGLVTAVTDLRGQPSAVEYDGFARLVSLTPPHPESPGALSPRPSVRVTYYLPADLGGRPYSAMRTETHDGASLEEDAYLEAWAWVDGLGRGIASLTEADPDAAQGDGHAWVVSDLVELDAKGAVRKKYLPFYYDGEPLAAPLTAAPLEPGSSSGSAGGWGTELGTPVAYGGQRYDAFGRQLQTFDVDGTVTLQSRHHALATDLWDAADREAGAHQGTFASELRDGHGRTLRTTERAHHAAAIEARHIETEYLPTGEPEVITRKLGDPEAPTAAVTRWLRYDTLGRLVLNVEPHVSRNFDPDPDAVILASTAGDATALRAWRYAYDDAGELVGTSDARGCGSNYAYDA